jgi:hypothetical protein
MDLAAVVAGEVRTWHTGRLVDGEVGRTRERQCDATQSDAPAAVGAEVGPPVHGVGRHPRRLRG